MERVDGIRDKVVGKRKKHNADYRQGIHYVQHVHFCSNGGIVENLPHDLKRLESHLANSGWLFAVVDPFISFSGSRNEVPMEANKIRDNLDKHELPLLDTRRDKTYNKTKFTRES